jgi:hypothetical protein
LFETESDNTEIFLAICEPFWSRRIRQPSFIARIMVVIHDSQLLVV